MARDLDNKERNREMRNLYKAWSRVDSQIELPRSLTGDALLPLLDSIPAHQAPERDTRRRVQFSPFVFSWKSVSTYAAALVLIVALSALLSRNPSGQIQPGAVAPNGPDGDAGHWELSSTPEPYGQPEAGEDTPSPEPAENEADTNPPDPADTPAQPDIPEGDNAGEQADGTVEPPPVGGIGASTVLYEDDVYRYTWRPNNPTDPERQGYPLTVNIIDIATEELAFMVDVASIQSVARCFVYRDTMALLGESAFYDGETVLLLYNLSQPGYADNVLEHSVPGDFVDALLYKNVVNLVTYAPSSADPGCEIIQLPNSSGEDMCIIAAVDLDNAQVKQLAFAGASADISLFRYNAYISYEGESTENSPDGRHNARVWLDGMDIELRTEE